MSQPPGRLTGSVDWSDLRTTDGAHLRPEDAIAILPIGSTEQHGPHLPLGVDTLLVEAVARRAAGLAGTARRVLVLPAIPVSLAEHHMGFFGTLTLDLPTFQGIIRCVVTSVARHGVRRVLLLNGHGGNRAALLVMTDALTRELGLPLAAATYWELAPLAFAEILEGQRTLRHACEAETSMMLALAPDAVGMTEARGVAAPADGLERDAVHRWHPMSRWTASGVVGTPSLATARKGERLLDAAAAALARRLTDGSIWADAEAPGG